MTPSEILQKHEDANEYHFHDVDRKFIIEAMEEYAKVCHNSSNICDKEKSEKAINLTSSQTEISDEEIEKASRQINYGGGSMGWIKDAFIKGAKWYREQLKNQTK